MSNTRCFRHLVQEIDYVLAKQRALRDDGPLFIFKHGHHVKGTLCAEGETVEEVCLWDGQCEYPLLLAPAPLVLFDCLRKHPRLPASKIEEIMLVDPFYVRYGWNRRPDAPSIRLPRRQTAKVYVHRIRSEIERVCRAARTQVDPQRIIVSDILGSNMTCYRFKAQAKVVHSTYP